MCNFLSPAPPFSSAAQINIVLLQGDDEMYFDDTPAELFVDAGEGNDAFLFGQIFGTQRDSPAVPGPDAFETTLTTR